MSKNAPYIVYTNDEDFTLNKKDIENSGGGSGEDSKIFYVEMHEENHTWIPEFTYNDVKNAFIAGKQVFIRASVLGDIEETNESYYSYPVVRIAREHDDYIVTYTDFEGIASSFYASDASTPMYSA